MNSLKIVKLEFEASFSGAALLPGFLGNTIRGGLGNRFKNLFCTSNHFECVNCNNRNDCVYSTLFKNQIKTDVLNSVPNPFVIEIPNNNLREYKKGDSLHFSISIFGNAVKFADTVIHAIEEMFYVNFASTSNALKLNRVIDSYSKNVVFEMGKKACAPHIVTWSDEGANELEPIRKIRIRFLSPVQILRSKKLLETIDFPNFIDSLFSRIADLIDVYEEDEFVLPYNFCYKKPRIIAEYKLGITSIQQEKQQFSGVLGEIVYSGNLTRYMPYIDLGSQIHIGKLTTRGFGEYRFEILE